MAIVTLKLDIKDAAYITANAAKVLKLNEPIFRDDGFWAFGDGATPLSGLAFQPIIPGGIPSGLVSGGVISIGTFGGSGTNNDIRVAAAEWFIVGFGLFTTLIDTDFLDITLSSAGTQRFIGIYGKNDGTIIKVEGSEAALASYPSTPSDHALLGYVLVSDASLGTTPDLSGYLLKSDKATQADVALGTNDDKYLTSLSAANKVCVHVHGVPDPFSPSDGQYYYFGNPAVPATNSSGTNAEVRQIGCPVTGTIETVVLSMLVSNSGSASGETGSLILKNTTKATLHTISSTITYNTGFNAVFVITGLSIAVTKGDKLQSLLGNTTWATNPTGVYPNVQYVIRP